MADTYRVYDPGGVCFVTFTVHQWVDVFSRAVYVQLLLENLRYCQQNKGLQIYAWVVVGNHCHLIISVDNGNLADLVRDYKKHTAKVLVEPIENNEQEEKYLWSSCGTIYGVRKGFLELAEF